MRHLTSNAHSIRCRGSRFNLLQYYVGVLVAKKPESPGPAIPDLIGTGKVARPVA